MMKIKWHSIFSLLCVVVLVGCSSGSVPGDGDDGGSAATGCLGCPCVGDLDVARSQGNQNICSIQGVLTQDATLPALSGSDEWHIVGSITVDAGVLNVAAGSEIFADSGEYIYVMPGASLRAIGRIDAPIRFSSVDSDYDLDASSGSDDGWVGIILEEGNTSSANRLEYVIVAEAGEPENVGGKNINAAITLLGSHENTVLRNVQVHDSYIDGVTLDGSGTVNLARLERVVITGAGRDGIHYQQFAGLIKDFLVIHRPGEYSVIPNSGGRSVGGRAGIRGGGNLSLPFIVNGTLVGGDTVTEPGSSSSDLEVAFIFDSNIGSVGESVRMANTLTNNFRNGCYSVTGGVDLSMAMLSNAPDSSFVDGVHCVNDVGAAATISVNLGGSEFVPDQAGIWSLSGDNDGLRYYTGAGVSANFFGQVNSSADFTSAWYLESVNANLSEVLSNAGPTNRLNLFNDGDASIFDSSNDSVLSGIVQLGGVSFFCGTIPADFPVGVDEFINPTTEQPVANQPTSGYWCGFIKTASIVTGFNLGVIGGVVNSSSDVFDGWTLHRCGAIETDPDFCPG